MERRAFIGTTTLTALAGTTACGAATHMLSREQTLSLEQRLERGMAAVRDAPDLVPSSNGRSARAANEMVRLGLKALVLTDVCKSIPDDASIPEPLAQRIQAELPVLDECSEKFTRLIAGMSPRARRKVQRAMRRRPRAAMEIADWIDQQAADQGLAVESRARLRRIATDVTARARRQSIGSVIDDTVQKVERIVAQKGGNVAALRESTAQGMIAAIWQAVEDDGMGGAGAGLDAPPPPPGYEQPQQPQQYYEEPPPEQPIDVTGRGDTEIAVGAVMMGAGPVVFGIVAGILAATGMDVGLALAIAATPGGTLVIVGLIILIIGLAQNA